MICDLGLYLMVCLLLGHDDNIRYLYFLTFIDLFLKREREGDREDRYELGERGRERKRGRISSQLSIE